jgi:aminopeptidase N
VNLVVRRAAAALSAVLVAGLVTLTPADARQQVGSPGAPGIGDSYFPQDGNGGYDVAHYDIHDTYRIRSGALSGWTDVRARATQDLSSLNLDLVLTPDAVTVDGRPATYAKAGRHELRVTPAAPIARGTRFVVRVRYHGIPRRIGWSGKKPFLSTRDETMATNEPHIAPWWFPANDHPRDKATYDITVRVPRGNQAISNGVQVGRSTAGGWTSWHWRMRQPMASYLAFFAAGRFRIEHGVSHGRPWTNAVSRVFSRQVQNQQLRLMRSTPGIVAWLETQFGHYPFSSTGGVVTSLFSGFALENQSRPTYPFLGTGHQAHTVVVHELAHQWFGDQVSVERWRDLWLNEGFATWVEWRYHETHGRQSAGTRLRREYAAHPAGDAFWRTPVGNPGPHRMFTPPVYLRGAMTLQALRQRIGDAAFHRVLRTWVRRHSYGNGTTEQLEQLAEQVSGKNLGGFFEAWLHSGTKPGRTAANGLG